VLETREARLALVIAAAMNLEGTEVAVVCLNREAVQVQERFLATAVEVQHEPAVRAVEAVWEDALEAVVGDKDETRWLLWDGD
jgi:hypothetical protein